MSNDFEDRIAKIVDDYKQRELQKKRMMEEAEEAKKISDNKCFSEWETCRDNIILPAINKIKDVLVDRNITPSVEMIEKKDGQSGVKKSIGVKITIPHESISLSISFTHLTSMRTIRVSSSLQDVIDKEYDDISIKELTKNKVQGLLGKFIELIFK